MIDVVRSFRTALSKIGGGRAAFPRARRLGAMAALVALACAGAFAATLPDEWPQWRGPQRDGGAPSFEPPATWPEALRLVWQTEVGQGDSSPLVSGGRVFVFTRRDERETVTALDSKTGEVIWRQQYEAPYSPLSIVGFHGAGPFSTPLLADGRIFTYGISQILTAWSAVDGKRLWQRELAADFGAKRPIYGTSTSPLFANGRLIVAAGGPGTGAIFAIDPATGADVWRLAGDGPAYGSPTLATLSGIEQIVTFTQRRLVGIEANTGALLWELPYQVNFDNTALTPLIHDGLVILSAYRTPIRAYRPALDSGIWKVTPIWENADVTMDYSSPVLAGERLLGFSVRNKGQYVLLDPATGGLLWSGEGRQGENSFLIAVGSTVLAVGDQGEMQVLRVVGDTVEIDRRYPLSETTVWAHPALLSHHVVIKDRTSIRMWEIPPG